MRIYQRNKQWCVDYRNPITGKRIREIIGANRKQAEERLAKVRSEEVLYKTYGDKEYFVNINKKTNQITLNDMIREYLEYSQTHKKSFKRDKASLLHFNEYLFPPQRRVKMGSLCLSEITTKMIEDYRIDRLKDIKPVTMKAVYKKTIKPSSINREIACFKHLFSKAVEWGYAQDNPVKRIKMYKEDNSRVRYLEKEEIEELLKACDMLRSAKYLKSVVIVALNTGMRKSELFNLKWKNVDLKNDMIYIEISKNGEGAYIPINTEIKAVLKSLSPIYEQIDGKTMVSEFVFRGKGNKQIQDIRTAFDKATKIAGIKDFRFHDLRHTFASHLVMNGVDIVTVKELMRHKTIDMTLRYSHLSPKHKREAIEGLYIKEKDISYKGDR